MRYASLVDADQHRMIPLSFSLKPEPLDAAPSCFLFGFFPCENQSSGAKNSPCCKTENRESGGETH